MVRSQTATGTDPDPLAWTMENTAACPMVQGTPIFRVFRRIDRRNDTRDPVTASTTRRCRVRFPMEASRGLDSSTVSTTVAGTTVTSAATRFEATAPTE